MAEVRPNIFVALEAVHTADQAVNHNCERQTTTVSVKGKQGGRQG